MSHALTRQDWLDLILEKKEIHRQNDSPQSMVSDLYSAWQKQPGASRQRVFDALEHRFQTAIKSLTHKLCGRSAMTLRDATYLVAAMLLEWEPNSAGHFVPAEEISEENATQVAKQFVRKLFEKQGAASWSDEEFASRGFIMKKGISEFRFESTVSGWGTADAIITSSAFKSQVGNDPAEIIRDFSKWLIELRGVPLLIWSIDFSRVNDPEVGALQVANLGMILSSLLGAKFQTQLWSEVSAKSCFLLWRGNRLFSEPPREYVPSNQVPLLWRPLLTDVSAQRWSVEIRGDDLRYFGVRETDYEPITKGPRFFPSIVGRDTSTKPVNDAFSFVSLPSPGSNFDMAQKRIFMAAQAEMGSESNEHVEAKKDLESIGFQVVSLASLIKTLI